MGKGLRAPCSPLAPPRYNRGAFQALLFLGWLEAGFHLAGRGMFVDAQKLPTSYGDGGVPPSLCTCKESGTRLTTHIWQCTLQRAWLAGCRRTGFCLEQRGCSAPTLQPPLPPRCPGRNAACPCPRRRGRLLFLILFLNFDFSSCEKWDCNIRVRRASCGVDLR